MKEWKGLEFGKSKRAEKNRENTKVTGCEVIYDCSNDPHG